MPLAFPNLECVSFSAIKAGNLLFHEQRQAVELCLGVGGASQNNSADYLVTLGPKSCLFSLSQLTTSKVYIIKEEWRFKYLGIPNKFDNHPTNISKGFLIVSEQGLLLNASKADKPHSSVVIDIVQGRVIDNTNDLWGECAYMPWSIEIHSPKASWETFFSPTWEEFGHNE